MSTISQAFPFPAPCMAPAKKRKLSSSMIQEAEVTTPLSRSRQRQALRRRPAGLRGDVCGDARTRRAADGRGLGRRPSQVSKNRRASPLPRVAFDLSHDGPAPVDADGGQVAWAQYDRCPKNESEL